MASYPCAKRECLVQVLSQLCGEPVYSTRSAGCVGEQAEGKKAEKYAHLAPAYLFQPVAIETSGAIGSRSRAFLRELGRRVGAQTGEARSTSYLFQRLSVAIQRGNAAAVMGCAPRPG